ncbi:MAG: glycosyltransferase family 2 protein [Curtobacterium sp.]
MRSDAHAAVRFGVAISTVGARAGLAELLDDLAQQTLPPARVVVADQSGGRVQLPSGLPLRLDRIDSAGGLSAGRNAAVAELGSEVDYLVFPNDTSRLPRDLLERLAAVVPGHDVAALTYLNPDGPRYRFEAGPRLLDPENVWQIIEPAMALSVGAMQRAGAFDVGLGTGSAGPFQSGEGTDLLLRLIRDRPTSCLFLPDLAVLGPTEGEGLSPRDRRRKLRGYARGYGRVLRLHRYGALRLARSVAGALTLPVRSPERFGLLDGLRIAVGRVAGYAAPIGAQPAWTASAREEGLAFRP